MAICEIHVVDDVGSGLCGKMIVGLKAFDEKDVWSKVGYTNAWGLRFNNWHLDKPKARWDKKTCKLIQKNFH